MRLVGCLLLLTLAAACFADPDVDALLAADEAPLGVVFEIVESDEDALRGLLPRVRVLAAQLRERYPEVLIAVVTHGREQFGLLADEADGPLADIHQAAKGLGDVGIDLHVCGVHAGWDGYAAEDFPAYVDVSASGPAQIRDYRNLGYQLIQLDAGHD